METIHSVIRHYRALMDYHDRDVWCLMDCQNRFVYANRNLNKIVGLNDNYNFEGLHMTEPPAACYDVCAQNFIDQNEMSIQTLKQIEVLDIHPGQGENWFTYIFYKKPILRNGQVLGTLHRGCDVLESWRESIVGLQKLYHYFTGKPDVSLVRQLPEGLTEAQSEVLFLLLCDKKPKEIAAILGVQESAVRGRIVSLKSKLGVHRVQDIVEAAVARGYHQHIPARFTGRQVSVIIG